MRPNHRSGQPFTETARSRYDAAIDAFDVHARVVGDVVAEAEQVVQAHAAARLRRRQHALAAGLMLGSGACLIAAVLLV